MHPLTAVAMTLRIESEQALTLKVPAPWCPYESAVKCNRHQEKGVYVMTRREGFNGSFA